MARVTAPLVLEGGGDGAGDMAIDVPGSDGSDARAGPESDTWVGPENDPDTRGGSVGTAWTDATGRGTGRGSGALTRLAARDAGRRSITTVAGAETAAGEVMTTAE